MNNNNTVVREPRVSITAYEIKDIAVPAFVRGYLDGIRSLAQEFPYINPKMVPEAWEMLRRLNREVEIKEFVVRLDLVNVQEESVGGGVGVLFFSFEKDARFGHIGIKLPDQVRFYRFDYFAEVFWKANPISPNEKLDFLITTSGVFNVPSAQSRPHPVSVEDLRNVAIKILRTLPFLTQEDQKLLASAYNLSIEFTVRFIHSETLHDMVDVQFKITNKSCYTVSVLPSVPNAHKPALYGQVRLSFVEIDNPSITVTPTQ